MKKAQRQIANISILVLGCCAAGARADSPRADAVFRNGHIYTADATNTIQQSVAIAAGKLIYVGSDAGVADFIGPKTTTVDLHGRTMMPGIIDGHMHPIEGGARLLACDLNYEQLTEAQFQQRIQACLDATKAREPDGWLDVESWYQQGMLPTDTHLSRATLDALKTSRPIKVSDGYGHTELVNSRALQLAKINRSSADPMGGVIERDKSGEPSGLLQDAGSDAVDALLPSMTEAQAEAAARRALKSMARQGITSFLDAAAPEYDLQAFTTIQKRGQLTARAHIAPPIDPVAAADVHKVVAAIVALRKTYDQGPLVAAPTVTVRNAKLFLDGVINGPAFTGALLQPYLVNHGTAARPDWVPGPSRGPDVYFPAPKLKAVVLELAKAGIDPHMHVDGDRAVHEALDSIEAMRKALPGADIRPGLAHCEMVTPADFARFKQLAVFPVLSMQWEKPGPDIAGLLSDYIGPQRAAIVEPAGLLAAAGAAVAFGSDWPVDPLDEWFALKVGVTRAAAPSMAGKYPGRLGTDPGLDAIQALRAATIVAARELHEDDVTGSLEPGKFADLIILDRDPLSVAPQDIARVKVLQTIVGGRIVYRATKPSKE